MTPTLAAITFDCADSGKLAAFWSELLGRWVVEAGEFAIEAGPHSRDLPLMRTVTVDAVTRAANVARATLYRHFPSGNDLLAAAFHALIPPAPTLLAVAASSPVRRRQRRGRAHWREGRTSGRRATR